MKTQTTRLFLVLVLITSIYACKHEDDLSRWDTNMLAPLLHSTVGLNNLVADSLLLKSKDNAMSIVYKNSLYKATIDSLFKIPDTSATSTAKLETLVLKNDTINYNITLGAIAKQSAFGFFITANNGQSKQIPPIPPVSSADIPVDAGSYFETMTLKEGTIVTKISNGLPIDIKNVIFRITNKTDASIVVQDTFPVIKAGASDSVTTNLAGKTIQRNLVAKLVSLSSPGSNGAYVKIDTTNALKTSILVLNLKPLSATAIFPAQNLINNTLKLIALDLPSVKLSSVNLRHGNVVMTAYSTLQDNLYLTYSIPSATKNGSAFSKDFIIPPAPKGGRSSLDLVFDFTGYTLDLTAGSNGTFNTLATKVLARIQYTGTVKTISLSDSIYFHVGFKDLLPDFAKGYLGKKTINLKNTVPFSMFGKVAGGTINLQTVNFKLHFENGIGVDENFVIQNITAINSRTKMQTVLSGTIVGKPISLAKATDAPTLPQRVIPFVLDTALSPSNSNIKTIIESLPDRLQYEMTANINPNGNPASTNDFVYYGTGINASLNMEIPLNLVANKLKLKDTASIDFSTIDALKNKKVTGGQLTLLVDNGFPLDANIQVFLLNDNFAKTDSLISIGKIDAAPVDAANKVITKKRSKLAIPITPGKLDKLLVAKKILLVTNFTTMPAATLMKIYSDYNIDFKLVGDFKYGIK
jgi:hypothetical protein